MPHVYLPTEHSEGDLVLAGQLAELLESDELYVTWSGSAHGYEEPQVETLVRVREPEPAAAAPQHGLLTEVIGTMAAFVAALFAPRQGQRTA